tara:strand:+ start:491 stop:1123 length:633 start_codon:yes stop_codon:yes gene_type:complete
MKADKTSSAHLRQASSGGLFVGFLYVLVFMSILSLGIWQSYESKSIQESFKSLDERMIVIEEQMNIADETNNDSLSDISSSIQFLDKEVRKLWDLSNKRNKANITKLIASIKVLENSIESINSLVDISSNAIKNNRVIITANKDNLDTLKLSESDLADIQSRLQTIGTQLILIDDSVQALNNYKKQLNQTIAEIQTEITAMGQETLELQD